MESSVFVKETKKGKGLFAARDFKKGESILEINVSHVVSDVSNWNKEKYPSDVYMLANDKIIRIQPPEKYMNHSSYPNAKVKRTGVKYQVIALRPIAYQEAVVMKYLDNLTEWADAVFRSNGMVENVNEKLI